MRSQALPTLQSIRTALEAMVGERGRLPEEYTDPGKLEDLLNLESVGGPEPPDLEERAARIAAVRNLLGQLVRRRFQDLSRSELEQGVGLIANEPADLDLERQRLEQGAELAFQLHFPKPRRRHKYELEAEAREIWKEEEPASNARWFERSRQWELILTKLAEWIIEHEEAYRAERAAEADAPSPETPVAESDASEASPRPAAPTAEPRPVARRRPYPRLLVAVGLGSIALAVAVALALSAQSPTRSLPSQRVADVQHLLGITTSSLTCKPDAFSRVSKANAAQVGLTIQGVRFGLSHVFKIARDAGRDSFDYIFTPQAQRPRLQRLRFIYRSTPGAGSSNGLVLGKTNDGFEVVDNKVGQCDGFSSSLLSNALDANDSDAGVRALNVVGSPQTEETTNFLDALR